MATPHSISSQAGKVPALILEIQGLIGHQATMELVEKFGGLEIHIPFKASRNHHLTLLLGRELAGRLTNHYGGCRIYIAKMDHMRKAMRNIDIVTRYQKGTKARSLAREYGLTERHIFEIIRKNKTSTTVKGRHNPT